MKNNKAIVTLSGGMDSTSILLYLLREGYQVKVISFDYGQKHKVELDRANDLINYLKQQGIEQIVSYDIVNLNIGHLLTSSSLVEGGSEVPEGHYEEENMKQTVVCNRNSIFLSIAQAVALSWANETNTGVDVTIGIHSGDHQIYKDCRQEFRDAHYKAFLEGNWNGERVSMNTPYLFLNKFDILQDGEISCNKLGIDFNEVYKRTNTSYKPIHISPKDCEDCKGKWYSDYKSASSVERIEAFIQLGRPDPVAYADKTGPVSWEVAKAHVEEVLKNG